jgi:hypothetical protein
LSLIKPFLQIPYHLPFAHVFLRPFLLLMLWLAQTYSKVLLSFRGTLRKTSKSIWIALRLSLSIFKLETTSGIKFASCILPLFHMCFSNMEIKLVSDNLGIFLVECLVIASSQQCLINLFSVSFCHLFVSVPPQHVLQKQTWTCVMCVAESEGAI